MRWQRALSQSIFCSLLFLTAMASLNSAVFAQDLSKTVLPLTQLKLLGPSAELKFATGFCLTEDCRFVGTNYHVAMMAQIRKIKGDRVIHRYMATGPDDDGATNNDGPSANPMKYNPGRDIAIYELRYPLPHYHGIPFSLNDLQLGQEVDIYAYPKESISPVRGLLKFHGAFKGETTGGLLAFGYSPSNGKSIRPGASGGLVIESKSQQVVGILSGVAKDGELVAMAVPTESLANFVSKAEPWLAQSLFPSTNKETISPASADLYPRFVSLRAADSPQGRHNDPPPRSKRCGKRLNSRPIACATLLPCRALLGDRETRRLPLSQNMKSESSRVFSDSASIPTVKESCRACLSLPWALLSFPVASGQSFPKWWQPRAKSKFAKLPTQ